MTAGRPVRTAPLDAAMLASLVELAHDAVLVRELDGRIRLWNAGAETLYGWTQAEALGRSSHELLATRFPCSFEEIERQLVAGDPWEGELLHRTRDGAEVVVESRWVPKLDEAGEVAAILEVNRDVTDRVAAERSLSAEGARFRALFESSLDAILMTAPDGRIFAANAAAEVMFGRSEEEIVKGGRDLLVDVSDPRLAAALRERERKGRFRADLRALRADGTPFEAEVSSVVFHDESGERRTSMIIRDVNERVRALAAARESEARFRALADAAFEAVFIHEHGRILDANRAASALFGYTVDELTSMHVLDLVPESESVRVRAIIEAGGDESYETAALGAGGAPLFIEVSRRSIVVDGRPARVVVIRDVTERRRARQLLEEQNERLRELDALKSQFVALVSHELRTPLTSVLAYLAVLEAGEAGPVNERQRRYLGIASSNARRLHRLVDDLLLIARADSGEFTLARAPLDLAELARHVVESFRPLAEHAGVDLRARVAAEPVVDADRDRVLQLLDNLVSNALEFTRPGGSIEVSVDASKGAALLSVSDTGAGIPAGDQPHLFERFYRGGDASRRSAGSGLGLAVVREIVEAHGGEVRVESEPGRGSTFTVELPLPP